MAGKIYVLSKKIQNEIHQNYEYLQKQGRINVAVSLPFVKNTLRYEGM